MAHPLQQKLQKLTQNLWWTWRPEVRAIFRDIDLEQYHKAHRNPLRVLKEVDARLPGAARRRSGHPDPDRPRPAAAATST